MSAASRVPLQLQSVEPNLETSRIYIKKIMMATDFSEESRLAAIYAAHLAKQMGSELDLLHVVPDELYVTPNHVLDIDLQKAACARGMGDLHEFTRNIPELRTLRHKDIVLSGPVAEVVVRTAEEHAADLIVLGSHGRGGVTKLALGSVAEKVIRNLHRPVLVIGPQCSYQYAGLNSLLLAVDSPIKSLRAAQYAVAIARQSGAALTLLHIFPAQVQEIDFSAINNTIRDLRSLIPNQPELRNVQFKITKGETPDEILRIARESKATLIVTSPKKRSIFADRAVGSVLSRLISESQCPVLAVSSHY